MMVLIEPDIPREEVTDQYVATFIKGKFDSLSEVEKADAEVNLENCINITTVPAFDNLNELNLTGCKNLVDISALRNISYILMDYCPKITNLSTLNNIDHLVISGCNQFTNTDISSIHGIRGIDLCGCTGITDITNITVKDVMFEADQFSKDQVSKLEEAGIQVYIRYYCGY